jgi:hypothetical protein
VTLRYQHGRLELGDIVLLWNAEDPSYVVTDLGTGLERLRWAIGRDPWPELVHGRHAAIIGPEVLDAIRTTVLLLACGIAPGPRGPGSAVRRLLRLIPRDFVLTGLSGPVRAAHRYWTLSIAVVMGWPDVVTQMEQGSASLT